MTWTRIATQFAAFAKRHRTQFSEIPKRQSALLEMGALIIAIEHYRLKGYAVSPMNMRSGVFKVKLTASGYPYNFSWFKCSGTHEIVELHANLPVRGAHLDDGIYVVDVAVVVEGKVPTQKPSKVPPHPVPQWRRLDNADLISFIEAKHMVVYPMLLAQFIGIVHEIKPEFLNGTPSWFNTDNFFPALVTTGHLSGTSSNIVSGFSSRGFSVSVIHAFETKLAALKRGAVTVSPFA